MSRKHGWLIALMTLALLVAACGPTPAPTSQAASSPTPAAQTSTPAANTPAPPANTRAPEATRLTESTPGDDWRSKGAANAPVVLTEYSDFQ